MRRPAWLPAREDVPGIALATLVGLSALALVRTLPPSPFLSDIFVALVLGAVVQNSPLRRVAGLGTGGDADRHAAGLRFTGRWLLRLAIVLMGLKLETGSFGREQVALLLGIVATAVPSTFFLTHALAARLGVRRPLADLVAGGTMICGSSAVNALSPVVGARREEQGVAIGTIFLFSVVALLAFRPIALVLGLDPVHAGLWSGLAVNDLSSAVAVGKQMGPDGGVFAAASKSVRILLLAPTLLLLAVLRGAPGAEGKARRSAVAELPSFLLGYVALAAARAAGDRLVPDALAWRALLAADRAAVDVLMVIVAAGIGLNLGIDRVRATGPRALLLGGLASLWLAGLTLTAITLASRGAPLLAAAVSSGGLLLALALRRAFVPRGAVAPAAPLDQGGV